MNEARFQRASRRNPRLTLSQYEADAVTRLLKGTRDRAHEREAALSDDRRLKIKRVLSAARKELFAKMSPDFRALAAKVADQTKPGTSTMKQTGGDSIDVDDTIVALEHLGVSDRFTPHDPVALDDSNRFFDPTRGVPFLVDPAFARELWWGETHSFASRAGLNTDVESDPCRIWGHIEYGGDPLIGGNIGVSEFFFLTPDRLPIRSGKSFEIRPRAQIGGWASGWTGFYEFIWAEDDKWSKCWQNLRATASLSSGEILDSQVLNFNLFSLEDESPVGQANTSLFMGWSPVLRFDADLAALRARGVSIIFEMELRFDYQLEGESDLWLRHRAGSNTESIAGIDNAVTFSVFPGIVNSVS